jgi:hypothetical protein
MQNTSKSSVARIKLGTAVNSVEKNIMILSGNLLRISAAILPNIVPKNKATPTDIRPSLADIGKDSAITSDILRPFFNETPKSPLKSAESSRTAAL